MSGSSHRNKSPSTRREVDPSGNQSMKGSSQLESTTKKNKTEVFGLWSLPDDVAVNCIMAKLSRLDLAALAMASKIQRSLVVSSDLRDLRWKMGSIEPCLYVLLHMFPDPNPRWFILHPVQRRLKPVQSSWYPSPESGSCFVVGYWGVYTIGGLINGKPTSKVRFFDCFEHRTYCVPPMKIARSGASAGMINDKIYVVGGCWDVADSSNWVEVYDIYTQTWEFLFVFTPKMPLKFQQSLVIPVDEEGGKEFYGVDEDGQNFALSPTNCICVAKGKTEPNPKERNDWVLHGPILVCRSIGGRILWCLPYELDWKQVKGLEELQQLCEYDDIIRLCINLAVMKMTIFWKARPQGPDQISDLWYAEISLGTCIGEEGREFGARLSGPVLSSQTVLTCYMPGSVYT